MAHTSERVIAGIPLSILFRTTPCTWEQRENENVFELNEHRRHVHPLRVFETAGNWLDGQYYEPWSVRANFLSLRTDEQFVQFLNKTGYFSTRQKGGVWSITALKAWQNVFVELLRRHPSRWLDWVKSALNDRDYHKRLIMVALQLHTTFKIKFGWETKKHRAVLETNDTLTTILATIYIDQLRGAKFGFCARSDCRKGYEVQSKHKRKYCSQYCAHLESVRRLRRKRKKRQSARQEEQ